MFGLVSLNIFDARHPFRKWVLGCIQSTSFCHRNHFFVFRNEHVQSIHYFRSKTHVWGGFAQFRCRMSLIPKTGVAVHRKHEFLTPKQFLRFSQRTCPIHYFRSKTNVWGGFAQFCCRTSPIPKTGVGVHRKHEFLPTDQFLCFTQLTCPIHKFRSKTHVWGGFAQFRCRTSPVPKTGVAVDTKHEFLPPDQYLCFSQRTFPIHYFRSKTHVRGGFAQFRCRTSPIPKTGVGVHKSTRFCHRINFFVFRNKHAQSTTLGPKHMFGVVSHNFVAARHPFRKWVSGCIQARVFATGTISSFFATNIPNPLL
jgi:hypothetical protein